MLKGKHIILGVTGSIAAYSAGNINSSACERRGERESGYDPLGERVYYSLDNGDSFQESDYGRFL